MGQLLQTDLDVFHGPSTQDHFHQFSIDKVIDELKTNAPDLVEFFGMLGQTNRHDEQDDLARLGQLRLMTSMATLLKCRSVQVLGIQLLLTFMLIARSTSKQVKSVQAHVHACEIVTLIGNASLVSSLHNTNKRVGTRLIVLQNSYAGNSYITITVHNYNVQAIAVLNHIGVCTSHTMAWKYLRQLTTEARYLETIRSGHWIWVYDNLNLHQRIRHEREVHAIGCLNDKRSFQYCTYRLSFNNDECGLPTSH